MDENIKKHSLKPAGRSQDWKLGFFLAVRELKKANKWTTALIITVMTLTFLNLVVVSGILVGLIEGSIEQQRERVSGDIIISTLTDKKYIERSHDVVTFLNSLDEVDKFSARYISSGAVSANYDRRTNETDHIDEAGASILGIDPEVENSVTGISKYMVEGEYLTAEDHDTVLIGANMLSKYLDIDSPGLKLLKNTEAGSKIKLKIGDVTKEVRIKGVIKSKTDFDQYIVMTDSELKKIANRYDNNVNQIAIKLKSGVDATYVKNILLAQGFGDKAKIQIFSEAIPKFVEDMKLTFGLLGNMIGSIGIAVASITIFIIIFVNAITRRKYIGIMKGIGIRARAIEISYIFQSLFYAVIGVLVGAVLVFLFIQPYLAAHPINFPFSDGILVATASGTFFRGVILLVATLIAGYIPARIVAKQNTLDAILGR